MMTIFSRISDIINANLNAILDQAEDPEKLVRMITQEMEETLVEVRSASARHLADKKALKHTLGSYQQQSARWESKAELAINKGRDDLAKAALREKNHFEFAMTAIEADLTQINIAIDKLKHDTEQLEAKLHSAKARQKALIVRGETAKSLIKVKHQLHDVSFDNAFSRFASYERKLDEMEGEIESFDLGGKSLSAEIQDLEKDAELSIELDALKARLGIKEPAQQSAQV